MRLGEYAGELRKPKRKSEKTMSVENVTTQNTAKTSGFGSIKKRGGPGRESAGLTTQGKESKSKLEPGKHSATFAVELTDGGGSKPRETRKKTNTREIVQISEVDTSSETDKANSSTDITNHEESEVLASEPKSGEVSLSEEEKERLEELRRRQNRIKRRHRTQAQVASKYTEGGPQYIYKRGPDGEMYAVKGEVEYDTTREDSPEQTIEKMKAIKKAVRATPEPTLEDKRVANEASQKLEEAKRKLRQQQGGPRGDRGGPESSVQSARKPGGTFEGNLKTSGFERRV
jgi:hypothetical protein